MELEEWDILVLDAGRFGFIRLQWFEENESFAELERQEGVATEFDEGQWYSLIDFVTVFNKEDVRCTFKDGTEIKV